MLAYTADAMEAEAGREYNQRFAPAATLADAHSQWHAVHGAFAVCPMDCGASESMMDAEEFSSQGRISCGHCKGRHDSVAGVRECATFHLGENDRRCF